MPGQGHGGQEGRQGHPRDRRARAPRCRCPTARRPVGRRRPSASCRRLVCRPTCSQTGPARSRTSSAARARRPGQTAAGRTVTLFTRPRPRPRRCHRSVPAWPATPDPGVQRHLGQPASSAARSTTSTPSQPAGERRDEHQPAGRALRSPANTNDQPRRVERAVARSSSPTSWATPRRRPVSTLQTANLNLVVICQSTLRPRPGRTRPGPEPRGGHDRKLRDDGDITVAEPAAAPARRPRPPRRH